MNGRKFTALFAALLDTLAGAIDAVLPFRAKLFFGLVPDTIALLPGGAAPQPLNSTGPMRLLLDPADIYEAELELPRGLTVDARAVVEMQLHRLMPLRPELLAWDCVVDRGADPPRAQIFMARRSVLAVAEALGADSISVRRSGASPEFLRLSPKRLRRSALRLALLAAAFWSMALLPQIALEKILDWRLAKVEKSLAPLTQEVLAVQRLRDRLDFLNQDLVRAGALRNQLSRRQVLDELALDLPDGSWLQDLSIRPDGLTLHGYSKDATALLARFTGDALFTDAHFTTPITRIPGSSNEEFTLALSLRSQGGSR